MITLEHRSLNESSDSERIKEIFDIRKVEDRKQNKLKISSQSPPINSIMLLNDLSEYQSFSSRPSTKRSQTSRNAQGQSRILRPIYNQADLSPSMMKINDQRFVKSQSHQRPFIERSAPRPKTQSTLRAQKNLIIPKSSAIKNDSVSLFYYIVLNLAGSYKSIEVHKTQNSFELKTQRSTQQIHSFEKRVSLARQYSSEKKSIYNKPSKKCSQIENQIHCKNQCQQKWICYGLIKKPLFRA